MGEVAARYRNHIVAMDILSTGVPSAKGYQHILVIIDLYTKFQQYVPLKTETAEEVCEAWLQHWYAIHGAPEKLLTDQGSAFTSHLLYDMLELLKMRKVFTTAYHPQTDGRVERQNRVILDMLAKLTGEKMSQWPRYLGIIAHAFNAVENSTTGVSPYFATFGANPRSTVAQLLYDPNKTRTAEGVEMRRNLRIADEIIKQHQARHSEQRQLQNTESGASIPKLVVGEKVMLFNKPDTTSKTRKLEKPWAGRGVVVGVGTPHPLNVRIAKDGVTDHKQEDNQAKGYVTRHISQVKPLPTTPLLPTRTKAPATRTNRGVPHLKQNNMEQANQRNMESDEQEEQATGTPRRSERIKQRQQRRSEEKKLRRSKRIKARMDQRIKEEQEFFSRSKSNVQVKRPGLQS
jgi:hypothetical protein